MSQRNQSLAQRERDAAIARIGRTRRWLIAAAAALTAGFAALISAVAPGRSVAAHSTKTGAGRARPVASTAHRRASTKLPPLEGAKELGLGGPAQAPQPSPPPGSSQAAPGASQASPGPSQAGPGQSQAPPGQSQVSPDQAPAPAPSNPPVVSGGS